MGKSEEGLIEYSKHRNGHSGGQYGGREERCWDKQGGYVVKSEGVLKSLKEYLLTFVQRRKSGRGRHVLWQRAFHAEGIHRGRPKLGGHTEKETNHGRLGVGDQTKHLAKSKHGRGRLGVGDQTKHLAKSNHGDLGDRTLGPKEVGATVGTAVIEETAHRWSQW